MAPRTLIAALFSGGLAVACAATDDLLPTAAQEAAIVSAATAAPRCKRNDNRDECSITVTVRDSASGCELSMEDDQKIIAFPRGVLNKRIFWQLDDHTMSKKFIFTQDGIAIDGNAGHVFDGANRYNHGKGFVWRNRNPGPGEFYYAVHVKDRATEVACDLDPKIRNEN
jgi:hypothetical protein